MSNVCYTDGGLVIYCAHVNSPKLSKCLHHISICAIIYWLHQNSTDIVNVYSKKSITYQCMLALRASHIGYFKLYGSLCPQG